MNVFQALKKLDELKDKCTVLSLAIEKFERDQKDKSKVSYEIQLLVEIHNEYDEKRKQLEHQLEITQLSPIRGVNK